MDCERNNVTVKELLEAGEYHFNAETNTVDFCVNMPSLPKISVSVPVSKYTKSRWLETGLSKSAVIRQEKDELMTELENRLAVELRSARKRRVELDREAIEAGVPEAIERFYEDTEKGEPITPGRAKSLMLAAGIEYETPDSPDFMAKIAMAFGFFGFNIELA